MSKHTIRKRGKYRVSIPALRHNTEVDMQIAHVKEVYNKTTQIVDDMFGGPICGMFGITIGIAR